jgi:hypothetical protein
MVSIGGRERAPRGATWMAALAGMILTCATGKAAADLRFKLGVTALLPPGLAHLQRTLTARNLLHKRHQEYPGAAANPVSRKILAGLQWRF